MKIILKEDVTNLGYKDDVVEVKDGYGRNYLIPQGKAVIANNSNLRQLEENQRQRAHKLAKIKADAEAAAAALADVALTIGAMANTPPRSTSTRRFPWKSPSRSLPNNSADQPPGPRPDHNKLFGCCDRPPQRRALAASVFIYLSAKKIRS